jgi:ADP-ribose pyrophosphatase
LDIEATHKNIVTKKDLQPWRIVSDETVFSSPPYIRVRSHAIELPGGKIIEPYFRIDLRPSAITCAVTKDHRVLVARQYRLLLPGGLLEAGEIPLAAAKRELLEDTGFAADQWESLGHLVPDCNYRCGEVSLFLARGARKVAEPDDDDLEEAEWLLLPFARLMEELRAGRVVSLGSAAAVALAHARLTS